MAATTTIDGGGGFAWCLKNRSEKGDRIGDGFFGGGQEGGGVKVHTGVYLNRETPNQWAYFRRVVAWEVSLFI